MTKKTAAVVVVLALLAVSATSPWDELRDSFNALSAKVTAVEAEQAALGTKVEGLSGAVSELKVSGQNAAAEIAKLSVRVEALEKPVPPPPPPPEPTPDQELLQPSNLHYVGTFRFPEKDSNLSAYGGHAAGVDLETGDIYVVGNVNKQQVCRIRPPEPVNSEDIAVLPVATTVEDWFDPVGDELRQSVPGTITGGLRVGGLLPHEQRLLWTIWEYYDADVSTKVSHGWWDGQPHGVYGLDAPQAGYVGGYLARVPERWRLTFGDVICGRSAGPNVNRRSTGPAAFGFNSAALGEVDPVPTAPLVYYPNKDGQRYHPEELRGASTNGAAFLTDGLILLGNEDTGEVWYGGQTSDSGKLDPCSKNRGSHSEGTRAVARFYDPAELAEVSRGQREPWSVRPYAERVFDDHPKLRTPCASIASAAFDDRRMRLYVFQYNADKWGCCNYVPLVHVYEVH